MGRTAAAGHAVKLIEGADAIRAAAVAGEASAARFASDAPPLVRNVATRTALLDVGEHLFPVTVNDGEEPPGNSYVVSPLTAYTGYADYELAKLGRPWLAWPLRGLTRALGALLVRARLDRIVQVNNWLLSTNLYPPDWNGAALPEITRLLVERFPDHAIAFRSLNEFSNGTLLDRLASTGYRAIPSRQVYLFDGRRGDAAPWLKRHNTRIDATLVRRMPYDIVAGAQLTEADYSRLEQLYNLLYLDKYCPLNPQFTAEWLRRGQLDGWLELRALRSSEGRLDGVLGWFTNGPILTTPIVGYDTSLPQRLGLYRLITRLCLEETVRRRCILNFSSGAAHFKRLRGGEPEIEYSMVYVDHLSAGRQRVWLALQTMLRGIGVPLMRRFEL